jgi:hypothetical protein
VIFIVDYDIICARCGKKARINAEDGTLCLLCWRTVRKEKREAKIQTSLDKCFSYGKSHKMTEKEEKIINNVMEEMARAKLNKRKVYK